MRLDVKIKELRLCTSTEDKILLKDINFILEENNVYTILGKNGSGKSTLIKSLSGLLDKRFYSINGSIITGDKDITKLKESELLKLRSEQIKYVFQDAINSFDPLRKLGYYFERFKFDKTESNELLDYFLLPGLNKISNLYPYELSGGMAQRFSFVLSLLMKPELLILDEPTSGIDPAIANLFLMKIKEFSSQDKKTILLVTQDIDFAKSAEGFISHIKDRTLSNFKKSEEYFNSSEILFKKSWEKI